MHRTSLLTDPDQLARVFAGKTDDVELTGIRIAPNASQILAERIRLPYGVLVSIVFVLISAIFILTAAFEGMLRTTPFTEWRAAFLPPVLFAYLLLAEPALRVLRDKAASSLVVKIPEYETRLEGILNGIPGCSRKGQLVGFSVGFIISVSIFRPDSAADGYDVNLTTLYLGVLMSVMFGYMSWLVYTWIIGIRIFAKLQAAATNYEPLKCEDIYPVGRWAIAVGTSLILASALSMMFLTREALLSSTDVYVILVLTAFGITFAAAWSTHRTMDETKKNELNGAIERISELASEIKRTPSQENADQLRAWIALESRLENTSSWPFDTAMFRRMFLAVAIPGVAVAARMVPYLMTD